MWFGSRSDRRLRSSETVNCNPHSEQDKAFVTGRARTEKQSIHNEGRTRGEPNIRPRRDTETRHTDMHSLAQKLTRESWTLMELSVIDIVIEGTTWRQAPTQEACTASDVKLITIAHVAYNNE